ncbi:MAG: transglycosylase domain-containing protein, partial [Propionicimonas sp.]|nr:transglycosylase domain-containing protein [Propionicimonas sp.]
TFWTDPGFDPSALARAVVSVFGPEQTVGCSTLTQQYIKVMYLTQEKTLQRKATEILLAVKIGQQVPKEEILERYLNTVYFGRGAYGIEAASQAYFGKPQSKLTQPEAVALVDIVNSPGNLDPAVSENAASDLLERYQYTLNALVDMGKLTSAERSKIYDELPEFPEIKKDSAKGGPKGFLLKMAEDELKQLGFSDAQINGGGLTIVTTFDRKAQDAVVEVAQRYAKQIGGKKHAKDVHPGIASIDNATGGVIALYGGPDYTKNFINWGMTRRPTGSTFKPYALTAALRQGWTLQDKVNGNTVTPPGEKKPIYGRYGRISLLQATTRSINPAYVDLVIKLENGHDSVVQAAEDAGVPHDPSWDDTGYRIPLGGGQISPLSQAEGYSTFANQGRHVGWHVIDHVVDSHGEVLYQAEVKPEQTMESDVATDVTYALTKVAQDGTGRRAAQLGWPAAGKTGTYYNSQLEVTQASWFVGFTKQITTAVMVVSGDKGTGNLDDYAPGGFYGSGYPSMIWLDYMKVAMKGKDRVDFAGPTSRVSTQKPETSKSSKPASETPTASATPSESITPTVPETTEPTTAPPTTAPPTTAPPTTAPPTTAPPTTAPTKPTSAPATTATQPAKEQDEAQTGDG